MPELALRNLPLPHLVALAAIGAVGIAAMYRADRRSVSAAMGRTLLGLRLAVGLGLLVLLADPVQVSRETRLEKRRVLIAVDSSRSALIREPYRPADQVAAEAKALGRAENDARAATRAELAAMALASGWLDDLRRKFEVDLYSIADDLRALASTAAPIEGGTDLLRPLARELARRPPGAYAGIVLITDGRDHGRGDPRERLAMLAELATPVAAVGVGALELPPDLRIESIDATGKVFAGDEVKAQVVLVAAGLGAADVQLEVRDGDAVIHAAKAALAPGGGRTSVELAFRAGEPGRRKLTVRAAPLPGETFEADNSRDLWLDVLSSKVKVLLLDGAPRWEERYLRSSWSRDENVELASFLVTPPPERRLPADFPRSREALFAHEVVVLGDVEPGLFARDELDLLRDFVAARGGTLVAVAGERSMPYRWADTPLAELLPVELLSPPPRASEGAALAGEDAMASLTPAGLASEVTRLVAGRERNVEVWEALPAPRWICPTAGAKPGTEVLAAAKGQPLLAWRAFGPGRVFWIGFDSTWKWRYKLGDELHRRFWGQLVRWAASRRLTASDAHVRLSTDSAVYAPGKPIAVEALAPAPPDDAGGSARADAVIEHVASGRKSRLRLEPIPRSGGRLAGSAAPADLGFPADPAQAAGEYRVQLDVPWIDGYASLPDRAAARFAVEPETDPEALDAGCGKELLEAIARTSGGISLPLSRFREAALGFPSEPVAVEETAARSLIDRPGLLAAGLLGCLALEWLLRKRRDLV